MKKKRILIGLIIGAIILILLIPFSKVKATEEIETIQFQDENFYKEMIQIINKDDSDKIVEKNDQTLQIKMKQEDIKNIIEIILKDKAIKNIKGIEKFTELIKIDLSNKGTDTEKFNEITDISYLKNMEKLNYVCFDKNKISDFTPLKDIEKLETLDICYNPLPENIDYIGDMKNLKVLWLVGTNRKEVAFLEKLENLEQLFISENQIEDMKSIENLSKMINILFSKNKITRTIPQNGKQEIAIPPILIAMKNQNSKLYTTNDYSIHNCSFTEDKKSIIIDTNGVKKAYIKLSRTGTEISAQAIGDVEFEIIVEQDSTKNETNNGTNKQNNQSIKDNTKAMMSLPKTGIVTNIIIGVILPVTILVIIFYIQYKRYEKIK